DRSDQGVRSRRAAGAPAPRRRRRAVRPPPRDVGQDRRARRGDGLDPGDKRADEPRHGGNGGEGREEVPALRAFTLNGVSIRRYTRPVAEQIVEAEAVEESAAGGEV